MEVVIYKATDDAGDVWESYKGGEPQPLWQISLTHSAPRPVTYMFRDRFSDFLRSYDKAPSTLQEPLKPP